MLPKVDSIIYLDGGGVKFSGKYEELEATQSDFLKIAFARRESVENADTSRSDGEDDRPLYNQTEAPPPKVFSSKATPDRPIPIVNPGSARNLMASEQKS